MSDSDTTNTAKKLAEITGRPKSYFDASEYEIPDFDDQEIKCESDTDKEDE
jgi:hypothetical protein